MDAEPCDVLIDEQPVKVEEQSPGYPMQFSVQGQWRSNGQMISVRSVETSLARDRATGQLRQPDLARGDVGQRSQPGRRRRHREPDLDIDHVRTESVISTIRRLTRRLRDRGAESSDRGPRATCKAPDTPAHRIPVRTRRPDR